MSLLRHRIRISSRFSIADGLALAALMLLAAAPAAAQAQGSSEAINLTADEQQWEGDVWRGLGGVRILYQDISVECDEMEYDRVTMDLVARGRVVMDQGPARFTADELYFNLGTKTGTFVEASGYIPPMYAFSGRVIEKLDETRYRVDNATFTTCDRDDPRPPWSFTVRKAVLEQGGYGKFHSTAMRVQGVPVFYLPYLVWPVKRDRAPGLLSPGFGYSQRRGFFVGLPLYVPLGRSYDTTIRLDYFSEGYYGLGNEWRWAPRKDASGQSLLYSIWDNQNSEWEWKFNAIHTQDDFMGFRLLVELEDLSDIDFFQEFDRTFEANTRRSLYSQAYLTKSRGPFTLNFRTDYRTTFLSANDIKLAQVPELELRVRSSRIGSSSFYWEMLSSVNYFDVDRGGELVGNYARADLFPAVSYTLPSPPWLSVTPRLGGRGTYYSKRYSEDRTSFENKSIDRTYFAGGVNIVGPSVSRIFNKSWGPYSKFRHLIEPRIEYSYLDGTADTTQIPVFDEVDSTILTNRARVVLANRLLARSKEGVSARELGTLEFFQEYSFSDPLNFGDGVRTSQWGPLGTLLRLTPTAGTGIDAQLSYDTFWNELRTASLAGSLTRPEGWMRFTWYQSFAPQTGERTSSQIRTLMAFRKKNVPFQASVHFAYDLERSEFQQQQLRLQWEGSCWGISAEYRDLRLGLYPTRDYRIVIDLKGVGRLPEIKGSLGPIGE